jgi:protein tyrosine phosphatase (PTP) superfamily phosphohydrolase (DUF442 family)
MHFEQRGLPGFSSAQNNNTNPSEISPRAEGPISLITESIAISNFKGAENPDELKKLGISAIVCLIERSASAEIMQAAGIEKLMHIPLEDGPHYYDDFRKCVNALTTLLDEEKRVLVHCHAGRSRSVAVVAAYIGAQHKLDWEAAVSLIREKRETNISAELLTSLKRYLSETS